MPDYLIVIHPNDQDDRRERIVRAKNKAQAIAHVVADTLKVDVASTDDAMRIGRAGGEVETAKEAV